VPRQNVVHLQNERLGEKLDSNFSDQQQILTMIVSSFTSLARELQVKVDPTPCKLLMID
jgi:hypothetical protein